MKILKFILYFLLLYQALSQVNISEPEPDIKIKIEIINETLSCISTNGEGYSEDLISFSKDKRKIDPYFNFDQLYSYAHSDNDKELIKKCRRRAFYSSVFPYQLDNNDFSYCGLEGKSNGDYYDQANRCRRRMKDNSNYSKYKRFRRHRRSRKYSKRLNGLKTNSSD